MTEFDMRQFIALLQIAPEEKPMVETPEHSEYLQKNIFDVLKKDGSVDLKPSGWLHGINFFVHKTSGTAAGRQEFF